MDYLFLYGAPQSAKTTQSSKLTGVLLPGACKNLPWATKIFRLVAPVGNWFPVCRATSGTVGLGNRNKKFN